MSIPSIPGYTEPRPQSLADSWIRPTGDFPNELWPAEELRRIIPEPTDWVVVDEHYFTEEAHGGIGSVLIGSDDAEKALERESWIGRDLGSTSIWGDDSFEDGLKESDLGVNVEFFCQVRSHHGLRLPSVEFSLPFLWYWDAVPDGLSWYYLNRAGRNEPLVRADVGEDSYRVEVRALELRQYLAARNLMMVVQHDFVPKIARSDFTRHKDEYRSDWCHFIWVCTSMTSMGPRPGFSRLLGQYVIAPLDGTTVPRWAERRVKPEYPEFLYAVDPSSGLPIRHTCDPDELGTYFDKDASRLHYLTPVYFRRDVLSRYKSEPSRYRVTGTRLECLDLWGVSISTNTAGLVEVYLGDLGRDLPPDEWPHWLGHNVPPTGQMAEDRFRRDFLNQVTESHDLPASLRRARAEAVDASRVFLGAAMWKELQEPERTEFDRLHGPTSDDPSALQGPILTMTKALIDAIEPKPLKSYLGSDADSLKQLQLLDLFVSRLQGDPTLVGSFRDLYQLRSAGGIAHLSGRDRAKVLQRIGIAGMTPAEAFDTVCARLINALTQLTTLMSTTTSGTQAR